jgi:hypothetical protein
MQDSPTPLVLEKCVPLFVSDFLRQYMMWNWNVSDVPLLDGML